MVFYVYASRGHAIMLSNCKTIRNERVCVCIDRKKEKKCGDNSAAPLVLLVHNKISKKEVFNFSYPETDTIIFIKDLNTLTFLKQLIKKKLNL